MNRMTHAGARSKMGIATDSNFSDLIVLRTKIQQKILGSSSSSAEVRHSRLMKPLIHERQTDPGAIPPLLPQPRPRSDESCDGITNLPQTLSQNVRSLSTSTSDPAVSDDHDNRAISKSHSPIALSPLRILVDGVDEVSSKKWSKYTSGAAIAKRTVDVNDDGTIRVPSGSGFRIMTPFPWRLHEILEDVERKQLHWIASWLSNGRGFQVHCQKTFSEVILPMFFRHCRYKSFQRQLYLYGFRSLDTQNMSRGEYLDSRCGSLKNLHELSS
jgi:hypothetical protein